jgi:hypothetical protein
LVFWSGPRDLLRGGEGGIAEGGVREATGRGVGGGLGVGWVALARRDPPAGEAARGAFATGRGNRRRPVQRGARGRGRDRVRPCLQAGPGGDRVEACRQPLSKRAEQQLAQGPQSRVPTSVKIRNTLAEFPFDPVRIECARCGRSGRYAKARLIERFGARRRLARRAHGAGGLRPAQEVRRPLRRAVHGPGLAPLSRAVNLDRLRRLYPTARWRR